MSFLNRLRSIVQAVEERWSPGSPEGLFEKAIADMKQLQTEARIEVTQAMAKGKRLERDYHKQAAEVQNYLSQAENALAQNQEDLARALLKRKRSAEVHAQNLKAEWMQHSDLLKSLKTQLAELALKIEEAEHSQDIFLAGYDSDDVSQTHEIKGARAYSANSSSTLEAEMAALKSKLAKENKVDK